MNRRKSALTVWIELVPERNVYAHNSTANAPPSSTTLSDLNSLISEVPFVLGFTNHKKSALLFALTEWRRRRFTLVGEEYVDNTDMVSVEQVRKRKKNAAEKRNKREVKKELKNKLKQNDIQGEGSTGSRDGDFDNGSRWMGFTD